MKKIAVLGITGSIGQSTAEVVRQHPAEFKIVLASSHNNYDKFLKLAEEFEIPQLVVTNKSLESQITNIPSFTNLSFGTDALQKALQELDIDIVLNAVSGSAGLQYSITTLERGVDLALANKESLVMAGHLVKEIIARTGAQLLPVDSEHSAIFQALGNISINEVEKIIITASGGSFRETPLDEFKHLSVKEALNHPTWDMGYKVTIDSATMMNKGLEVIEAHWLFDIAYDQIEGVIHPQSIVHSLVEFKDGSILAQMSNPTMRLPILYALTHPHHIDSDIVKTSIPKLTDLSFREIEEERYPLFFLALEVGKEGGLLPTVMNAANEAAVELFREEKIGFTEIFEVVLNEIESFENIQNPDLETIIRTNKEVFERVYKSI